MNRAPRILFVPVGRATFDQEAARAACADSLAALAAAGLEVAAPDAILMQPEEAEAWVQARAGCPADLAVVQTTTFVDARFIAGIAGATPLPLHLWSVPEPVVNGGRLKLNSLTGANLAAQALTAMGRRFGFTYGRPGDAATRQALAQRARAAAVAAGLRRLRVGVVGEPPPGFFNAGADELALRATLGVQVEHLNLSQILTEAAALAERDREALVADALARVRGGDSLPVAEVSRSAAFYAALARHVRALKLDAVAIRCWPEAFADLGAAACTAVSRLTDEGVMAACEADIHGAVSMWAGSELAGGPAYLGDLVHVDPERNTGIFWHCGAGAYSLASARSGPAAGRHPNRQMALTLEMGLKPGRVTVLRLAPGPRGYRLLTIGGEALDEEQKFWGTTVEIRTDRPAGEVLQAVIRGGFDHHYAIVWADVRQELQDLADLLGIELVAL